jgi:hypothetical protein
LRRHSRAVMEKLSELSVSPAVMGTFDYVRLSPHYAQDEGRLITGNSRFFHLRWGSVPE